MSDEINTICSILPHKLTVQISYSRNRLTANYRPDLNFHRERKTLSEHGHTPSDVRILAEAPIQSPYHLNPRLKSVNEN